MLQSATHEMRKVEPLPDVGDIAKLLPVDHVANFTTVSDPLTGRPIGGADRVVANDYAAEMVAAFNRLAEHHQREAAEAARRDELLIKDLRREKDALEGSLVRVGMVATRLHTLAAMIRESTIDTDIDPGAVADVVVDCLLTMSEQLAAEADSVWRTGKAKP